MVAIVVFRSNKATPIPVTCGFDQLIPKQILLDTVMPKYLVTSKRLGYLQHFTKPCSRVPTKIGIIGRLDSTYNPFRWTVGKRKLQDEHLKTTVDSPNNVKESS